ncbi:alkene reductase [Pedobacter antarcticus]|uniref:alkene reductase n=1 Tax=Pedobacter antarcticus TaxID=34086 RepID=UPI00292D1414|nr:alkene reductase [Pedobacter antarcticus]
MNSESLFSTFNNNNLNLKNRIIMAPMTRCRAGNGGIPIPMNVEYYKQRASAGLIISEATNISPQAMGFAFTPGIYNEAQIAGWQKVTEAVHDAGGLIFCQLWHVGRISHPSMQPGGARPVAPSAVQPESQCYTEHGFEQCLTPRALELDEIPGVVEQFRIATHHAKQAGFDGVEILAGGGYLIDQFLRDKTNHRTDEYGGSIPNRMRFLKEVVEAVIGAWSPDRVGIKLSPICTVNDIEDSNPEALFIHVVEQLNQFSVAYLHVMEDIDPNIAGEIESAFDMQKLRQLFKGPYMANSRYNLTRALKARLEDSADLIAFGRPFIANPDLVERLKTGAPLAEPDRATFYGGRTTQGYTDYPKLY